MSAALTTLYSVSDLTRRVDELGAEISRAYDDSGFIAVVVMNGGLFFAADLLRRVTVPVQETPSPPAPICITPPRAN